MKTSSAKQKGRRLQNHLREVLLQWSPDLHPEDIRSCSMGSGGEDILLSPKAREIYPISFEVKNQEKINIWAAYEQAQSNAKDHYPVVCFSRNRSEPMIALSLEHFLKLIR